MQEAELRRSDQLGSQAQERESYRHALHRCIDGVRVAKSSATRYSGHRRHKCIAGHVESIIAARPPEL